MTNEQAIIELRGLISDDRTDRENEALLIAIEKLREKRTPGQWVIKHGEFSWWHICSNCKETPLTSGFTNQDVLSNFCPNCGADMREDSEA